jgi:hypothetical protein
MKAKDMPREYEGREVIFTARVGSHNYNLNTEASDDDFKSYLLPTLEDLFSGKMVKKSKVSDEIDVEYKDIRELPRLLYKSNINFMEVLFSVDIWINPKYEEPIRYLIGIREKIAAMNIPYWWGSSMGIMGRMQKEMLVVGKGCYDEKLGYDPKAAAKGLRVMGFLEKYRNEQCFADAIWHNEDGRAYLLGIKKGEFTLEEIQDQMAVDVSFNELVRKDWYSEQPVNQDTLKLIELTLMDLVFDNIG